MASNAVGDRGMLDCDLAEPARVVGFRRSSVGPVLVAALRAAVLRVLPVGCRVCHSLPGDDGRAHAEGHCQPANPTDIARSAHCLLPPRRATGNTADGTPVEQRKWAN